MVYTLVAHLEAAPEHIETVKAKLIEAAQIYRKDKEIDWLVMQDTSNKAKFSIVERYAHESSQKYHLENPYWKTFDPYIMPLLAKSAPTISLGRHEELV